MLEIIKENTHTHTKKHVNQQRSSADRSPSWEYQSRSSETGCTTGHRQRGPSPSRHLQLVAICGLCQRRLENHNKEPNEQSAAAKPKTSPPATIS